MLKRSTSFINGCSRRQCATTSQAAPKRRLRCIFREGRYFWKADDHREHRGSLGKPKTRPLCVPLCPLWLGLGLFESQADYFGGVFRQAKLGDLVSLEPTGFGGISGRLWLACDPAAEKIDQHIVVLDAAGVIAQHSIEDAKQIAGFDGQSG